MSTLKFHDIVETRAYLTSFFEARKLKVKISDEDIHFSENNLICTSHVIIKAVSETDYLPLVKELASNTSIIKIKTSNL